ncbi:hypothetical protein RDI58_024931 [Solanum bulbocastanum]|uniref:Uncharacterized protein n=1 Tax=Solanum bulbocastanum TaxID=147425 RepID=A0AAN8Y641_SOLBU
MPCKIRKLRKQRLQNDPTAHNFFSFTPASNRPSRSFHPNSKGSQLKLCARTAFLHPLGKIFKLRAEFESQFYPFPSNLNPTIPPIYTSLLLTEKGRFSFYKKIQRTIAIIHTKCITRTRRR